MRNTILSILFIGGWFGGASVPEQAAEKMEAEEYTEAIVLYDSTLTLSDYEGEQRAIHFNRGQAYYLRDSIHLAQAAYSKCTNLSPREKGLLLERQVGSWAWTNIGMARVKLGEEQQEQGSSPMAINGANMPNMGQAQPQEDPKQKFEEALKAFKEALKLDPENETARFDYELLKKRMMEMEKQKNEQENENKDENQDQNDEKDDQDKSDQDDQQKKDDQEGESDEKKQPKPDNTEKKGQSPNQKDTQGEPQEQEMTQEQAAQLLEAMSEKEKQFIQQLEKQSPKKGRKRRSDGPDW